jgi:hypothetical protein
VVLALALPSPLSDMALLAAAALGTGGIRLLGEGAHKQRKGLIAPLTSILVDRHPRTPNLAHLALDGADSTGARPYRTRELYAVHRSPAFLRTATRTMPRPASAAVAQRRQPADFRDVLQEL